MRRTDKARSRGRLPARGEAGDAVATAERAERRVAARLLLEGAQARAVEELRRWGRGREGGVRRRAEEKSWRWGGRGRGWEGGGEPGRSTAYERGACAGASQGRRPRRRGRGASVPPRAGQARGRLRMCTTHRRSSARRCAPTAACARTTASAPSRGSRSQPVPMWRRMIRSGWDDRASQPPTTASESQSRRDRCPSAAGPPRPPPPPLTGCGRRAAAVDCGARRRPPTRRRGSTQARSPPSLE